MSEYKYIGKRYKRKDSFDRVTGQAKYVTDIKKKDMLYGKLILSEKAHSDFKFDFTEALKVKGIYKILTYKDIPKVKYNCMEWFTGISANKDELVLNERARFVGDRIALVLGQSKECVEEAIKKVKIEYYELPVVANLSDAMRNENIIKGDTNLAYSKDISCGNFEEIIKEADLIVEDEGTTPRTHHLAIENHSAMAEIDDFGNLIVSSASQIVFAIQMHLSNILNIPYTKIRVIKSNMGGSFGGKQQPLLEIIAGVATWITKKTVQIYMDREQSIIGTFTRNAMRIKVKTAVKKDGTIIGRQVNTYVDHGAYDTNSSSIVNAFAKKLFRLYKIDNQSFHGEAYYTNAVPGGACRAYGGPQAHAITEVNIDNVAKKLNMDPCKFRLKNLLDEYADDPVGGPNIGKAGIKKCIIKGMELFNWKYKYEHIKEKNNDRYAYGVGMACATHGNGYLGAFPDFINLEMILTPDNSVLVKIAVHEQGCGTLDVLSQIAAEALDLEPSRITVLEGDTFITPYDAAGTQASRVTFVAGGAIIEAGNLIKEKLFDTLNKVENINIDYMYTDNGFVKIQGSDKSYSYGEIATLREKKLFDSMSVYVHHVQETNPATFAAAFVEVKIDKKTGLVEIEDMLAVHDIGKAINPMLVEGQIQGGCQFSLGMGLSEEIEIDNNGNVKNKTLSKYHVLNSQDMPLVRIGLVETEDEKAPYGLKSVGEVSAVAPAPAVLNAINYALGTNITDYPANPERIVESIQKLENDRR